MFPFYMFVVSLGTFSVYFKHIISAMILLELMALSTMFLLCLFPLVNNLESYISLIYLAIAVCEGALGLSIIIMFSRLKGNESFFSANSLMY